MLENTELECFYVVQGLVCSVSNELECSRTSNKSLSSSQSSLNLTSSSDEESIVENSLLDLDQDIEPVSNDLFEELHQDFTKILSELNIKHVKKESIPLDLHLLQFGIVNSVVDKNTIVISALPERPALGEGSLIFDVYRKPMGPILEIFGQVTSPLYVVLLANQPEKLNEALKVNPLDKSSNNASMELEEGEITSLECSDNSKAITIQRETRTNCHNYDYPYKCGVFVYYAPYVQAYTHFLFPSQFQKIKGSDASWLGDKEPPEELVEFSDDEKERAYRKQLKISKQTTHSQKKQEAPLKNVFKSKKTPYQSTNHTFKAPDSNVHSKQTIVTMIDDLVSGKPLKIDHHNPHSNNHNNYYKNMNNSCDRRQSKVYSNNILPSLTTNFVRAGCKPVLPNTSQLLPNAIMPLYYPPPPLMPFLIPPPSIAPPISCNNTTSTMCTSIKTGESNDSVVIKQNNTTASNNKKDKIETNPFKDYYDNNDVDSIGSENDDDEGPPCLKNFPLSQ